MASLTYLNFLAKFGVGGAHPGGFHLTQELLSGEMITENSKILDAGCGTGQTSAYLYDQYGSKVTGIEINPIMVEKARNRFLARNLPITLIQGSIENIPLPDDSFDIVLSESVLAFVDKPKALSEFFRVLKTGGRLIANEMTINGKLSQEDEQEIKDFYAVDSLLLEGDWKQILTETGFKDIEIRSEQQPLSNGNHSPEFNFSSLLEPELFSILNQHANIVFKYHDILSYRVITCTKK